MTRRIGFNANRDEEEEDQKKKISFTEHPAMTKFFHRYHPAGNFRDATDYLTTTDIVNMLWEHGCGVGVEELNDWLIKNGYKDDFIEGMKMVWLLKEQAD